MISAGARQAIFKPPIWMQPELYYTDETGGLTPYVVDGRLNIISGLDTVGGAIPAPAGFLPVFGLAARNGYLGLGQSNSVGNESQNGDSAASILYDIIMDSAGLKAGKSGNGYSVTLIATGTPAQCAESNNSGFGGASPLEGETPTTVALVGLADVALALKGVTLLSNKWAAALAGKINTAISARMLGSTLFTYGTDAISALNAMGGAGYALRDIDNDDQESDANIGTSQAVFYDSLVNQLILPLGTLARTLSGQIQPVMGSVWQSSYNLSNNAGPAFAAYQAAATHPLFFNQGPNWIYERNVDHLHFTKAGQQAKGLQKKRALYQLFFENRYPDFIKLLTVRYEGGVIKALFSVPTAPLVIDTTTYGDATQHGLRAFDGGGDFTLSSIAANGSEIWMTPNRVPSGPITLNVGLDYAVSGGTNPRPVSGGTMCNICDSSTFLGSSLPHWVPHLSVTST